MKKGWSIGEVANLFDISAETLRYYEKAGVISIAKNKVNGYRNYSYEDIVILLDILFFRNVGVSLKDIDGIVKTQNLKEIIMVLKENQQLLSSKIIEMERQQQMLSQVVEQYENSVDFLGKFKIVSAPNFRFKFLGANADDLFAIINNLKQIENNLIHNSEYSLLITEDCLQQTSNLNTVQLGICIGNDDYKQIDRLESLSFTIMEEGEYLYTILATNYGSDDNATLVEAKEWLKKEKYHIAGPLYGHYMASCHRDHLDFYEVWIKAEKNI